MELVKLKSFEEVMAAICYLNEKGMSENGRPYSISDLEGFFDNYVDSSDEGVEFTADEDSTDLEDSLEVLKALEYLNDFSSMLGCEASSLDIANANIRAFASSYLGQVVTQDLIITEELKKKILHNFMDQYYGAVGVRELPDSGYKNFCLKYLNMDVK